jgi:hypothetical protein
LYSKINGLYVFKQDGIEIGRSKNLITTNGTSAILQYLTGNGGEWAGSIAIGAINTTANVNDLALKYEIARATIASKSYRNGTPNLIVIKGRVDSLVAANIYEVGVFPANNDKVFGARDNLIVTDFSSPEDWVVNSGNVSQQAYAAQSPFSPRVGLYNFVLESNSSTTNNNFVFDLSSFSSLDSLDLLVSVDETKNGVIRVTLTDVNGISKQLNYSFNGSVTSGYQVLSQNFSSDISTLSNISTVRVETIGSFSDITIDSIRVSVLGEISNSTALVSRSTLTTPIAKIYGVPLDIEYYVQIG